MVKAARHARFVSSLKIKTGVSVNKAVNADGPVPENGYKFMDEVLQKTSYKTEEALYAAIELTWREWCITIF